MKRIFVIIMAVLMTLAMAACTAGGSDSASEAGDGSADVKGSYNGFGEYYTSDQDMAAAEEAPEAAYDNSENSTQSQSEDRGSSGVDVGLPSSVDKKKVKLIYTANISVQTQDFDEAVKGLNDLVEKFGGYFESISTDNGGYYDDESYRYGSYTVRVPSDKYQKFINSVSEGMHVVNLNQNAEDIGQVYFETERRVETLKTKHDRLEELLKKATKMSDIIELESALSDTEYELEQYTSELKRYDSLVDYSTVYISIEKVMQYSTGVGEELSFSERLMKSIRSGVEDFGWGVGNLINWIGYHIIQIGIFIVIIIVIWKTHIVRKIKDRSSAKKEKYVVIHKSEEKEKSE